MAEGGEENVPKLISLAELKKAAEKAKEWTGK